eukprot:scaffold49258_cov50-Cyclotella_meneghiniana.AAC.1
MKAYLVRKYLAPSPATSKGRMKRPRTGIRSTSKTNAQENAQPSPVEPPPVSPNVNVIPIEPVNDMTCNVFCYAALADKHSGTMCARLSVSMATNTISLPMHTTRITYLPSQLPTYVMTPSLQHSMKFFSN